MLSMQMNSMNSYYTKDHAGSPLRGGASCGVPCAGDVRCSRDCLQFFPVVSKGIRLRDIQRLAGEQYPAPSLFYRYENRNKEHVGG